MTQARTLFSGCDLPRNAGVVERRHVHEEATRESDVAGDARALLAEGFLSDLDDDLLALLEHVRDQLNLSRRMRAVMAVVVRAAAMAMVAAATIASSAARGIVHARAKVVADARFVRRLLLRGIGGEKCLGLGIGGVDNLIRNGAVFGFERVGRHQRFGARLEGFLAFVRFGRAFEIDFGNRQRFRFAFLGVNCVVRVVGLVVRLVVVLGVLVVVVLSVRVNFVMTGIVLVGVMFVAMRFERGTFFLCFSDVLGQRRGFLFGEMLVNYVRWGVSLVMRLIAMFIVVLVKVFIMMRLFVMPLGNVSVFGSDFVERARSMQVQLVVLPLVDVAFDFIHVRSARGLRFLNRIRREMRVRFPLRN
jgi:hypothetical protein